MHAKKLQKMTLAEFNELNTDDQMTNELLDGVFLMSPRPNFLHQKVQMNLSGRLYGFLNDKPCNVITETEVAFQESVLVPDLFVYCEEIKEPIQRYTGTPLVVIEILSKKTAFYDMNRKLQIYEGMGVQEYWIISPIAKSITVHHFGHETASVFGVDDLLFSEVLEGFELVVGLLFE